MANRGRPTKDGDALKKFEVGAEPKLLDYLDDIVAMQGYGNSRSAVARRFIWDGVNGLIGDKRIPQR